MAYTRPMVMVFQEYASTSISTPNVMLPPCIIGPCYHIVDHTDNETTAHYGMYTSVGVDRGMIPNNAPGALIVADSVNIRLKNVVVRLHERKGITAGPNSKNTILVADGAIVKFLEIGDYVEFVDNTDPNNPVVNPQQLRITGTSVANGAVMLNRSVSTISANTVINVYRMVEELLIPHDSPYVYFDLTSERFSLTGVQCPIGGAEYPVMSAELYVGYRALRQDLSDIGTLYSIDEVKGKLGDISPDNPLAYGVSIAMANASIGIKYIGVDSDDLEGYTAAKDRLESHDPVYAIVPLTFSPAVLSMYKNHCEELSDPKRGMWRIALGCSNLTHEKNISEGAGMVSRDGDGDLVVLSATGEEVSLLSSSVDAGDTLIMTDGAGLEHKYTVSSVVSEDTLTITQSEPFDDTLFLVDTPYTFRVMHKLDKLDQAKEIASTSKAYGSRRFVHVWPDICVVDEQELPGYYLACAVAGGIGGLPSHYGFTRLSVSGIDAVKNSSDYFNAEQLDTIAEGGTFIFMQSSLTAPPHIRHQLTTDRSIVEMQELSFVKNFDYLSYICRDVMDAFIGKYNINNSTLITLKTALAAALETQKLDSSPKIGSRVLAYTIRSVQQLEGVSDRVEMYADVAMPYPLNTIGLHLRSVALNVVSS